jgi:hypothetical protein
MTGGASFCALIAYSYGRFVYRRGQLQKRGSIFRFIVVQIIVRGNHIEIFIFLQEWGCNFP